MNHSYFASLLENYRRRMDMDTSLVSIRKALHESYQNESFKLKERQRQSMARERRERMENDRILRNRMKEIEEKEKEITKRYECLRNWCAKAKRKAMFFAESNQFTGYGWMKEKHTTGRVTDHGAVLAQVLSSTKLNHDREKNSNLIDTESLKPTGDGTEQREKRKISVTLPHFVSTRNTENDNKSSQELAWSKSCNDGGFKRDFPRNSFPSIEQRRKSDCLRREPAKLKRSTRIESNEDLRQGYRREETTTPNTPFNSDFTKELIEYYKNGGGSTNDEKVLESKETTSVSSCTLKFGKQRKHIGKRGPFNMSTLKPDYEILVIDHGEEDNI